MKLVTFQSMDALKYLINNGRLICDDKFIDKKKFSPIYDWVLDKMNKHVENNTNAVYPIWAWVKCYNGVCPPKHRGDKVAGFDVKITFNKDEKDVFVTDFVRFSFLLNNLYIPDNKKDKLLFDELLKKYNISKEDLIAYVRKDKYKTHRIDSRFLKVCDETRKSFDKCITTDSDILQGCVWSVGFDEVESIEILPNDEYVYGSLNYKRTNGKRVDWQKYFYDKLN